MENNNTNKQNKFLYEIKTYDGIKASLFTCYYITFMPFIAMLISALSFFSTGRINVLGMLSGQFYILFLLIPIVFLAIDFAPIVRKQKRFLSVKSTLKQYSELTILLCFLIWITVATILQRLIFGETLALATLIQPLGISEGLLLFCFYFMILISAFFIKNKTIIKNIIFVNIIISLILSLITLIDPLGDKIFFHMHHSSTWAGMFLNSNHMAYYLTIFIGITGTLFCFSKKLWLKIFSIIAFTFLCIILCFNNTLGSLLSITLMLILLPFVLWLTKGKLKFKYFIPLIIFIATTIICSFLANLFNSAYTYLGKQIFILFGEMFNIIKEPTSDTASLAGTNRWGLWMKAFKEIMQSPVIGTGNVLLRPHNEYLQFAQVWGIPAMLIYITCFIFILVKTIKHRKKLSSLTIILLISVFAYCISGFFGNTMPHTFPYFMLILGFLIRCLNDDIQQNKILIQDNKISADKTEE